MRQAALLSKNTDVPATSLPFDRVSTLEPADVRLLRRVVRDRHQCGFETGDTLSRWPSVRQSERLRIFPYQGEADAIFDRSLIYEVNVLRVYAPRGMRSHSANPFS
jgi:uridine kinase